jgi:hypothetical protein
MKFNTSIPAGLKDHFNHELVKYRSALAERDYPTAWTHLENAHVLGQAYPIEHTYAHWLMLRFGFTIKSGREIIGQIPRLLIGGVKSFVGKIPVGNTGGSNVSPVRSIPIKPELQKILDGYK